MKNTRFTATILFSTWLLCTGIDKAAILPSSAGRRQSADLLPEQASDGKNPDGISQMASKKKKAKGKKQKSGASHSGGKGGGGSSGGAGQHEGHDEHETGGGDD